MSDMTGTAHFTVETGGHVVKADVNETAKKLFHFHGLAAKVGFIDYLRANRSYTRRDIGNFSEDLQDKKFRTGFRDFATGATQSKFDDFKSYVVATQLADFSRLQETGERVDSLSVFRSVFDNFFAPKTFLGYRTAEAGGTDGIMVGSPFGDHGHRRPQRRREGGAAHPRPAFQAASAKQYSPVGHAGISPQRCAGGQALRSGKAGGARQSVLAGHPQP